MVLAVVGLEEQLLAVRKDLHWRHNGGGLAKFDTCKDFACKRAREAASRKLGPYGHALNQSLNLWNDLVNVREFANRLVKHIRKLPKGSSGEIDVIRAVAAKEPWGLNHGVS